MKNKKAINKSVKVPNKNRKFYRLSVGIVITILSALFIIFIYHLVCNRIEYKKLEEAGYINKVSAGNYDLNIYRLGNTSSRHKIIGISGEGVHNYSIEMSKVNDKLKNNYDLIYIDRAGYGYSDDTIYTQTVERIIEDYRTALKNAEINGPYILMPHSIGGVYATYWESKYPEEIEGVIFIDTTLVKKDSVDKAETDVDFIDYLSLHASKLGIMRFNPSYAYRKLPSTYTEEEQSFSNYLRLHSISTKAVFSERREKANNVNKAYDSIKINNIPKIYINATTGARTIEELKTQLNLNSKTKKELGLAGITEPTDERLSKAIDDNIKYETESLKPYLDSLGNSRIVLLPGSHYIFEDKPSDLITIINDFVSKLG